jgi:hypothetical protein
MKKKCVIALMTGIVSLFALTQARGYEVGPIADSTLGATHQVTIYHSDLTTATTNTAQTLTIFPVQAKTSVEVVGMVLVTAFEDTADAAHNSTALTVGDGTDPDLFLTSTELNDNGSKVWIKYGRGTFALTTASATRTNLTNVTIANATTNITYIGAGGTTNTLAVMTGATLTKTTAAQASLTSASIAESLGQKVYTSTDTVDFTFTPNAADAVSALNAGEVRIFLRVVDAQ